MSNVLDSTQLLNRVGGRATPARRMILELLQQPPQIFSVSDIQKILGSNTPNQVTIYRILDSFVRAGIVQKVLLPDRKDAYFELLNGESHHHNHHHHFICQVCGTVYHLDTCAIGSQIEHITSPHIARIVDHHFELSGICVSCT